MADIRFGTDGWRAVIGEDFTFDNVRAVAQATAQWMQRAGLAGRGAVVGYDTRLHSAEFAEAVAEVLAGNGIAVGLALAAAPTPAISFAVRERGAGAGVVITSSHNPPEWNGFKVKQAVGNSAPPEVTAEIEAALPDILAGNMHVAPTETSPPIERFDPRPGYVEALREFVDVERIRAAGLRVAVDSMHGAAGGLAARVLGEGATTVHELRREPNPEFPGMHAPEPIARNLGGLMELIGGGGYDIGVATDGDGDRLGLVDERGAFLNQHQAFALLVRYLLDVRGERGERGAIVRSITSTRMIDRLGERFECPVHETAVGFKFLGPKMVDEDALVAGEESGGYALRGHIPERDGILSGLLLLDYVVRTAKPPSQLLAELYDLVGRHEYDRVDVALRPEDRDTIAARVAAAEPSTITGLRVASRDTLDGYRFTLEGGWWLLLRFSGTEPLLRIYAEMPSAELVRDALREGQGIAGLDV